ncbi:Na+/H+ antiporter subunit A [Mangrovibacillus cuniculi]|uniref:Na+/H+ antiporter subunit A n=1 Tax=Mangrovibacillus cuniculi TaxID=2593652 RepID=A0A7S8HGE7_9BACI|nr:Na+/H+ antiporter subunit A [Mangrovibacillus cuniculi]QPC47345.1 Na+/H+ antiporter subunit A [Mangrovibacillus cuniculi]
MSLLHFAIISPFIVALFIPLFYKLFRSIHTGWFVLILPVVLFGYFISFVPLVRENQIVSETYEWMPSFGLNFIAYVDGLGLLFALLITGIGSLVVLYSIYYLDKVKEKLHNFYVYLLMFMGAMLGVVLSDNLLTMYMFWEFTSISSFLLIGYWYHRERSRYGAQKSMLITVFGGLSMLGGIVLLQIIAGTASIQGLIEQRAVISEHEFFLPAMILILLGAFTKSAQFPFHIWLPDAMEAPTPVSAYLHSATMVKAGIYLVARLSPVFAESSVWLWTVALFGITTLFWGSFNAVKQTDLKGILAFSTISQLGMIMSMLGIGAAALHSDAVSDQLFMVATIAAIFHLINHATFKGALFMMVGIVDHETGTRDIRKLGGLMTIMPITFTIAMIGSFSMAGLPPFNGFLSKEMFFTAMISVFDMNFYNLNSIGVLFPIVAWVGSIFTFVYSMILVFKTFMGPLQEEKLDKKPHEAPFGMLISPIILISLVVVIGFFPNILTYNIIEPAVASILPTILEPGDRIISKITFWHGPTLELFMTIAVVIIGVLLYRLWPKWKGIYAIFSEKWTFNRLYDHGVISMERGAYSLTSSYMTGSIRSYLVYIFLFMIIALGGTMWMENAFTVDTSENAPIRIYEVFVIAAMLVATVITIMAKSRLTAVISLGVVGYLVSLLFVLFQAPDLALTQLVVETVSTALFLVVFYHLPPMQRHEKTIGFKLTNAIIAGLVGLMTALIGISASSTKLFSSISQYHIDNVYTEGAGKNMVNVILVDFRGFDTLFEVCVLGIAAVGIYAMIRLRLSKGESS